MPRDGSWAPLALIIEIGVLGLVFPAREGVAFIVGTRIVSFMIANPREAHLFWDWDWDRD